MNAAFLAIVLLGLACGLIVPALADAAFPEG